jgi:hypothetical protein
MTDSFSSLDRALMASEAPILPDLASLEHQVAEAVEFWTIRKREVELELEKAQAILNRLSGSDTLIDFMGDPPEAEPAPEPKKKGVKLYSGATYIKVLTALSEHSYGTRESIARWAEVGHSTVGSVLRRALEEGQVTTWKRPAGPQGGMRKSVWQVTDEGRDFVTSMEEDQAPVILRVTTF